MKVSVIIPTYNRPSYLAQAVHSLLKQTHPVFEIIIVDDGSAIKHRNRIDALKLLDDRISVYHILENKGVSAARNYGLEKSGGDYILFLDDDDLLHPHMVESNLKIFADDSGTGVVSSGYDIFMDANPPDTEWNNEHQKGMSPETIFSWDYGDTSLLAEHPFSALLQKSLQVSSCLVSRQAIGTARFPEDLTRGEDIFFWLTLASAGCSFRINHKQLGLHRLHRYSSLANPDWRKASLKYHLKLFNMKMNAKLDDRFIGHLHLAHCFFRFNRLQSMNHIFSACRIFMTLPMIPYWPVLVKTIAFKFSNKWRQRKVIKARKSIIAGNTCAYRQ